MNKNFLGTINGVRFYLFLMILATHYKYIISSTNIGKALDIYLSYCGVFAVLFFFILSGFCMALGYSEKFETVTKINYFEFIKKRMKKIYPLYIITGLIMLLLFYLPLNFNWLYAFIFLYIPMLTPYTKYPDGGGNGAGWFIASLFFCYLITPFFIKVFNKKNIIKLYLILYVFITIIAILSVVISQLHNLDKYIYRFPPIRLLHYSLGLVLGMMYIKNMHNIQILFSKIKHKYIISIFMFFLFLFSIFMYKLYKISNPVVDAFVISVIIIYLCNIKEGIIFKLLSNKYSQYLGNISFECYMIHYPLCILLADKIKPYCYSLANIIIFYLLLLFATIFISILYKNATDKVFSKQINIK